MQKIKTLFKTSYPSGLATNEPQDGSEWVFRGEGTATLKRDGSSCLIKNGILYKRVNRKLSKKSAAIVKRSKDPSTLNITESDFKDVRENSISCNETFDPITFHWPYWVQVSEKNHDDLIHIAAFALLDEIVDGSYEICGPKFQGNPYNLDNNILIKHGSEILDIEDRSFEGLKRFLKDFNGEGIVFHHENGSMFKIRKKDMFLFKNVPENRRAEWTDEIDLD